MTEPAKHSVSVAGVIVDDEGCVLLIRRRDNGRWELPGGVLELNEHVHDGLCREVREETGLIVTPSALTGIYKNMRLGVVALVFRCDPVGGELVPNDEVTEFRWATASECSSLMTAVYAVRVGDALRCADDPPAIRAHDGVSLLSP